MGVLFLNMLIIFFILYKLSYNNKGFLMVERMFNLKKKIIVDNLSLCI